jgi:hypothetical protein
VTRLTLGSSYHHFEGNLTFYSYSYRETNRILVPAMADIWKEKWLFQAFIPNIKSNSPARLALVLGTQYYFTPATNLPSSYQSLSDRKADLEMMNSLCFDRDAWTQVPFLQFAPAFIPSGLWREHEPKINPLLFTNFSGGLETRTIVALSRPEAVFHDEKGNLISRAWYHDKTANYTNAICSVLFSNCFEVLLPIEIRLTRFVPDYLGDDARFSIIPYDSILWQLTRSSEGGSEQPMLDNASLSSLVSLKPRKSATPEFKNLGEHVRRACTQLALLTAILAVIAYKLASKVFGAKPPTRTV